MGPSGHFYFLFYPKMRLKRLLEKEKLTETGKLKPEAAGEELKGNVEYYLGGN
jgi:hypothetical protein